MPYETQYSASRSTHKRREVRGGPRPLVQGVQATVGVNAVASNYGVSDDGTLVYISGAPSQRTLAWKQRNSAAAEPITTIPPGPYEDPRLAADGSRVLVTRDGDIWTYDIASGRSSRVSRDGVSQMGVWDPTGSQIAYSSAASGNLEAWAAPSDGSGQPRQLTKLGGQVHVDSWSPDGRLLSIHHHTPQGPVNILMVPMGTDDQAPRTFLDGRRAAEGADFSRDMRYVAYLASRDGTARDLYSALPGSGRASDRVRRRRARADVGRERRPVLSEPRWRADVRRISHDDAEPQGGKAGPAVSGTVLCVSNRIAATAVRHHRRWTTISRARSHHHDLNTFSHRRRSELGGGTEAARASQLTGC